MKREEIKTIFPDATAEQIKSVMDLHGADLEKDKGKVAALEAELNEKKEAFEKLNTEFAQLKESNASAEDWKAKFEKLTAEVAEREAAAKAEADAKEKAARIESRFSAVVGDKKFTHDAIRKDYLAKFTAALDDDSNTGKSDADILHDLVKDDAGAFENVTAVKIAGAKNNGSVMKTKDEILAIKDGATRRAEMATALAADPHFFD